MQLDWTLDVAGGVTLVSLHLQNDASVPRRVRVENRLDGPVLPPRRCGHPEFGWDEDGVALTLVPGETAGLGYACPVPTRDDDGGPPTAPPVAIVVDEPVTSREAESWPGTEEPTHADDAVARAIRDLGESRPPRAAVPSEKWSPDSGLSTSPPSPASSPFLSASPQTHPPSSDTGAAADHTASDDSVPAAVDEWLDAVATRVRLAERFDGASVEEATGALQEVGGVDGAARLSEGLDEDIETLQRVVNRATLLVERAESATVPVETLRRLA